MTSVAYGLARPFSHGRVFPETLQGTNPAAGNGYTYGVQGAYWERLSALTFTLATSSTAATRAVTLAIKDQAGNVVAVVPAGATQAASLIYTYCFLPNISTLAALEALTLVAPLPDLFLRPDWNVVVSVGSIQSGDQVASVMLTRERFVTDESGYPQGAVEVPKGRELAALKREALLA